MNFYNITFEKEAIYKYKPFVKEALKKETKTLQSKQEINIEKIERITRISATNHLGTYDVMKENFVKTTEEGQIGILTRDSSGRRPAFINLSKIYEANKENKAELSKLLFNGKLQVSAKVNAANVKDNSVSIPKELTKYVSMFLLVEDFEDIDIAKNTIRIDKQDRKFSKEFQKWLKTKVKLDPKTLEKATQLLSTIWGTKKDIHFVWSIDPADFMRQSLGDGWQSCHRLVAQNIEVKGKYETVLTGTGPSNHPWVHYSVDKTSTILYVQSKSEPLIAVRIMIYIDTKRKKATIGRAYPNPTNAVAAIEYVKKELKKKGFEITNEGSAGQHGNTLRGFQMQRSGWAHYYGDFNGDTSIRVDEFNTVGAPAKDIERFLEPWK